MTGQEQSHVESRLLCWCSYYVIVAWIWSLIWYLGLDPIKWMMMYALNEDGWRDAKAHKAAKQVCTASTQPRHHHCPAQRPAMGALMCLPCA